MDLDITCDTDNGSVVVTLDDGQEILFVLETYAPQATRDLYIALSSVRSIEVRPRQEGDGK